MFSAQSQSADAAEPPAPSGGNNTGWKAIVEPVEPFLERVTVRLAEQIQAFDREIADYAQYALSNQGKQLRPALVALSADASGELNEDLVNVAVIIEMVHLATLVHDDVMDEASLRRGRPTLAANWGNEISVLLGDCLFAHSLQLAASFPTPEICRAVSASTNIICSGEILQTLWRRNFRFTRAEYFKALEMKTAELFALSCDLGAALSGGTSENRKALRQFGWSLGTAYQVFDDCLDLYGTEATAGKSLGTDLANGKLTLPVLVALEKATPKDRGRFESLLRQWTSDCHSELIQFLEDHDALAVSRETIHQFLEAARQPLSTLPPSQSREGLGAMTNFLAQQTNALGVL